MFTSQIKVTMRESHTGAIGPTFDERVKCPLVPDRDFVNRGPLKTVLLPQIFLAFVIRSQRF